MIAVCVAVALVATARGSSAGGTSAGSSAAIVGISNARAAPMTNTTAKMTASLIQPCSAADREDQCRADFDADAQSHDAAAIVAVGDVARPRAAAPPTAGTATRPTRPRSSALRVSSYTCQPTATASIW